VSRAEERSNSPYAWGRAVADVTVLFDYFDFDPVPEDFEELTRIERVLERARMATSRWRWHLDDVTDRLRPVLRICVVALILLSGLGTVLGVSMAGVLLATTCLFVAVTFISRRVVARHRAREAARHRAQERAAYTLIEGPRRVPIDVLRVRDGAVTTLRPETLEALRG
jgi:hypothetical protein